SKTTVEAFPSASIAASTASPPSIRADTIFGAAKQRRMNRFFSKHPEWNNLIAENFLLSYFRPELESILRRIK
ncbi:MAG TPA: hypothetical protein V6C89_10855, partial [Drouetiella sp.]